MAPTKWDAEWIKFAKTISDPPTLPDEETEAKRQIVNTILTELPRLLPPPPSNITTSPSFPSHSHLTPADPAVRSTEDLTLPSGPAVRIYTPTHPSSSPTAASPLILFAHGGGWFAGNLETEDRSCRILSSRTSSVIVSVDYRCGFGVPLQSMVDDLYAAFTWSRSNATTLGADAGKVVFWGGSAGGALIVALAYRLVQEGRGAAIKGLLCMNTIVLHPSATPEAYIHLMRSYEENDGPLPFVAGKDTLKLYKSRDLEPPNTPIALFPTAYGPGAMKGFPPTWIITSGNDASRDDGTVLEAVLRDAGVRVKMENVEGLAHYFWVFDLPKANERFWDAMVGGVAWVLGG
ncbi:uncharacterized protein LTR77_010126 [Saxophila tyrrhenica]|uniref:Alpha/beta hydrolase fold-3 domain-containing protein n=1 Tax=Saxophila tyrrhenica TaxID=1690608 RepID=A0AAV9NZS2_9PEZI|nr:hypothetical protein LTR77_010126 [Saxophila tyrrhenica]